jgi:hypothetical protein
MEYKTIDTVLARYRQLKEQNKAKISQKDHIDSRAR